MTGSRRFRCTITLCAVLMLAALPLGSAPFSQEYQPSPRKQVEWIDVHVHLVGGLPPHADYGGAVRTAIAAMDEAGITKSVIMPPPLVSGGPPLYDYEDFIDAIRKYPGRFAFLGGSSLNQMIHDTPHDIPISNQRRQRFEERAKEIIHQGAIGFGELSVHHLSLMERHPYSSVPADHPLFLLLADIAARHDVIMDLHFDPVTADMPLPPPLLSPPNPPTLRANVAAFERLLAHNRKSRIVWAHAGSDQLGHWTVDLSRHLLQRHPNLYMSLRMGPGRAPQNHPLNAGDEIKPEWLRLFRDFPDRFVIGGDQFFVSPTIQGSGPGILFSRRAPLVRERTKILLSNLPDDLRRNIAQENGRRLYKFRD